MLYKTNDSELLKFGYEVYTKIKGKAKPVFLCVGSDKFVIDCLAPIVAEKLKHKYNISAFVYGGLEYNVNRTNVVEVLRYISVVHSDSSIVLIDATLDSEVGCVKVSNGAVVGLGNCLPNCKIGDLSILGVVGRRVAKIDLNSTRLRYIVDMAEFISKGCFLAVNRLEKEKSAVVL